MTQATVSLSRLSHPDMAISVNEQRAMMLGEALRAVSSNRLDDAAAALSQFPDVAARDAACLNLTGVICQLRGNWSRARRYFSKSIRTDRRYSPAEQNLRRIYELNTFGSTNFPVALCDHATLRQLRLAPSSRRDDVTASLWLRTDSTIHTVKRSLDWTGFAWAVVAVAIATAIGWPLVHSALHLAETNVLMLYLLCVLWIATHFSRGAAVLASVLGVAVFDFVFVPPYYTLAVADRQSLVTFGVMLLTALVISNLTHRVRNQSELARQAWERVESEFLRNTLLSAVSHELRTPLSAITGAASSLLNEDASMDSAARHELIEMIASESDRMERLISNLLDMSRLEAGKLPLNLEWLPLEEIVGSALRQLDRRVSSRQVKIDLPPQLPMLRVDGALFEQVLTNLIDNVVEYSPADSPIEIAATADENTVRIEVRDRGPGITPGTEQRVFEKFYRGTPTQNRRGSGLGLAIVQGIVQLHGGIATAMNRDGGGAVIRISLPIMSPAPTLDSTR